MVQPEFSLIEIIFLFDRFWNAVGEQGRQICQVVVPVGIVNEDLEAFDLVQLLLVAHNLLIVLQKTGEISDKKWYNI